MLSVTNEMVLQKKKKKRAGRVHTGPQDKTKGDMHRQKSQTLHGGKERQQRADLASEERRRGVRRNRNKSSRGTEAVEERKDR